MAQEFKGTTAVMERPAGTMTSEMLDQSRPLFEMFDPEVSGGLGMTPDGDIFEVRHPYWGNEDKNNWKSRTAPLPLRAEIVAGEVISIYAIGESFDPESNDWPTLGSEIEIHVVNVENGGKPHRIAPDGLLLSYPRADDPPEEMKAHALDPEAMDTMVEFGTPVAHGMEEHNRNVIRAKAKIERWLEAHGLQSPYLTMYPEDFTWGDTSKLLYVQKILRHMDGGLVKDVAAPVSAGEFAVMSEQLHTQIIEVAAAQHAKNKLQSFNALLSLLTAAAPIRDSSFNTTVGEHYSQTADELTNPDDFRPAQLPEGDLLTRYRDHTPYDWRELSRVNGSPSAGTLAQPSSLDLVETARRADSKLRTGEIVTFDRADGQHTDRLRVAYFTLEACGIGTAGGNIYKSQAAQELVSAFLTAQQLEYLNMDDEQRAAQIPLYEHAVEVGHANAIFMALSGKETSFIDEHGQMHTPTEMLQDMIMLVERHWPRLASGGGQQSRISLETKKELFATLSTEPLSYTTVDEAFQAFFQPYSRMTATDVLRYASRLEPDMQVNELLLRFAVKRREHIYRMEEEMLHTTDSALGELANQ